MVNEEKKLILVIEDDPDILELLEYNLKKEGFALKMAVSGEAGLQEVARETPALVILDLMLPGIDGLAVCRSLKQEKATASVPILMLTAKSEEADIVVGLETGADDYLAKPFSPKELIARLRALLRRTGGSATSDNRLTVGPIAIDRIRYQVKLHGQAVPFTLAEFRTLELLVSAPGRVFSRDQLLDRITGGEVVVIDRNVDVHIRSIRRKLGADAEMIETVRGVGYKCREAQS